MTHRFKTAIFLVVLAATLSKAVHGQSNYTYTIFDFPGAGTTGTVATGINDAGDIVGYYYDSNVYTHGFLWANGAMNIVDYPQTQVHTSLYGINNCGAIVGQIFNNNGSTTLQSFVLAAKKFTVINYPGSVATLAYGINDYGTVSGTYQVGIDDYGFVWSQGRFTAITGLMQHTAWVLGLNDLGDRVGYYFEGLGSQRQNVGFAYIKKSNELLTLSFPGAINTTATGINNLGQIVGFYQVSNQSNEGAFLYAGGVYTGIGPFANGAVAWGINNAGVIAGQLGQPDGGSLGFLATPAAASTGVPVSSGSACASSQ
jgi:chitinase